MPWADLACTYGLGIFDFPGAPPKDYHSLMGLYACLDRIETRKAYRVVNGIQNAIGDQVGREFFLAMTDTPEEGDARHKLYQARQAADRARDKTQPGGNG